MTEFVISCHMLKIIFTLTSVAPNVFPLAIAYNES